MDLQLLKGTKDYLPEEQAVRERVKKILEGTFKLYGYSPVETPILELYEVLASKYAGGAEILKETYKLTDQGQREIALRYDLTVPFSRLIGLNVALKMPFKRYEIGKVFRDGPVKAGRMREFTQCDVDVVGIKGMAAEAEIVSLTIDAFKKLGIDIEIQLNNRKLLSGILQQIGISEEKIGAAILSIDKLEKIGEEAVKEELKQKGIEKELFAKLFQILNTKGAILDVTKKLAKELTNDLAKEGIKELEELEKYLKLFDAEKNVKLQLSLARGLEIYTGTVFEVFMKNKKITSSLAAGGRFDKIIASFLGKQEEIPAVGISFGLDTIYEAIKDEQKEKTGLKVYIIPINTLEKSIEVLQTFRKEEIPSDMDFLERSISKNLDYANKQKIPFVVFVGQKELAEKKVKLRDMNSGKEHLLPLNKAVQAIKKQNKVH